MSFVQKKILAAKILLFVLFFFKSHCVKPAIQCNNDLSVTNSQWKTRFITARTSSAFKEKSEGDGDTYAIIVGISKYKNVRQLRFADKDALAFAHYLRALNGFPADSANIKVFINEDATLRNISNCMQDFVLSDKPKKNDRFFFYFAGHGDIEAKVFPGQGLLLLYGAPKQSYFFGGNNGEFLTTKILYDTFLRLLIERHVEVILIADACHSANGKEQLSGGIDGGRLTQRALEDLTDRSINIFSCGKDQSSIEGEEFGGGRGLFSYIFLKGLYGGADEDNNGLVTMKEIQRYIEDNVPKWANPNIQDPVMRADNPREVFGKVNLKFYSNYKKDESSVAIFASQVGSRGKREAWLKALFSKAKRDYRRCLQMIEDGNVDDAYTFFNSKLKSDTTSVIAIQLKRMLSEIYQQEAANIIIPMTENISRIMPDRIDVQIAYADLYKATELLGPSHYLFDCYRARLLFLEVLSIDLSSKAADIPAAISKLKASIHLDPNAPYAYFVTGSLYQQLKQLDSAKRYYQFYIDLIPYSSWGLNNMGLVNAELGNYKEAIISYEKAISIDPRGGRTFNNLGLVLLQQKEFTEAIDCFKSATENWSNSDIPFLNLALAYKENKQFDNAIKAFENAYRINPNNEQLNVMLGNLYFNKHNYEKATDRFEEALRINRGNRAFREMLGDAYSALGNWENAYFNYYMAKNHYPDSLSLLEKYAVTELQLAVHRKSLNNVSGALSLYEDALINFKKLTAKGLKNVDLLFNICCCYAALNRNNEFYESLSKLLKQGKKATILNRAVNAKALDDLRQTAEFRKFFERFYSKQELSKAPYLFRVRI